MLILDEGLWNGYTCLERGTWQFSGVFLVLAAICVYFALDMRRMANPKGGGAVPRSAAGYAVLALVLIVALAGASVVGLSRQRDLLFTEGNTLVERGCQRLSAYEDRFAMSDMKIAYTFVKGRGGGRHWVTFEETSFSRRLKVDLANRTYHRNLLALAPQAMADYKAKLEELEKPLPAIFATP